MELQPEGFIVPIPSAGISQGLYLPADKAYRVIPPAGWSVIPGAEGGVVFQSLFADHGYWPCMLISTEPAQEFQPARLREESEINALVAYEHTFEGRRMKTAEVHFVCDGVRYWVPFNTLAASFDRHFPAYLNCLRTLTPSDPYGRQSRN